MARYRAEGEAAFEPRSRDPGPHRARPRPRPSSWFCAAQTARRGGPGRRRGHHRLAPGPPPPHAVAGHDPPDPDPRRRDHPGPVQAAQLLLHPVRGRPPNECWQSDFTHYRLTGPAGPGTSRSSPGSTTTPATRCTSAPTAASPPPIVLATFRDAAAQHGIPASTLTDNGMVYTIRFAGLAPRRPHRPGATNYAACIVQKNSRPNHPTTCGKVERFQQTLKNWLRAQPDQPATIAELQALLDALRRRLQPAAGRTAPCPTRPPRPPSTPPAQSRPGATATPTPTTASATTRSTKPAPSPCASPAVYATSASDEPTPEPTSSCSSTTSTSASSTPPPANSYAN